MHATARVLWFVPVLALSTGAALAQQSATPPRRRTPPDLAQPLDHVPGELLVKLRAGAPPAVRPVVRQALGAELVRTFDLNGVEHLRLAPGQSLERALELLRSGAAAPWVEYAEPNYFLYADQLPDDPLLSRAWGLHNLGQSGGLKDADGDVLEAWQATTGSASVVVAIIDSGIDWLHPDLAANIWSNPGELAGNGRDDDGNGYIDDVRGWDFVNNDSDPRDDNGHGTHTAGTVGALGGNGLGLAGVAWNVRLMPLKFLDAGGTGTTANAILAIQYAARMGVRITNNSWGGGSRSTSLQSAIDAAGALFVASAGNDASSTRSYPAGYDSAGIVSVAATTATDGLASYSNYSSTWVDLGAPGDNVYSCRPGNQYGYDSGTSMAAPHVAGVAALLLAQNPGWSTAQLKSRILGTTDALAALSGRCVTGGRLNARRALGAGELPLDTLAPATVTDLLASEAGPHTVTLTFTAPGDLVDGGQPGSVFLCEARYVYGTSFTAADWNAALGSATVVPGPVGGTVTMQIEELEPGQSYAFALKVMDLSGNSSSLSSVAVATTASSVPGWTAQIVDLDAWPFYIGHDFDPLGRPAVAYDLGANIAFAHWNGSAWERETVMAGGAGLSIAYDPLTGAPTLTHGSGKLYFCTRGPTGWTNTLVESKSAGGDVTWLAYHPLTRQPSIAYRYGATGLRLATRSGTSWIKETADASCAARYCSLAFDAQGNPGLAYSDDFDGDGWLDSLWLARKQGGTWTTQKIDGPVRGYGVHASIAFDPSRNSFVLSHETEPSPRIWRWSGSAWTLESVPEVAPNYVFGLGLAVAPDGTLHVAYSIEDEMRVARRDPLGVWTIEKIDPNYAMPLMTRARLTPDGRMSVSYGGVGAMLSTRDNP